MRHSHLIAGIFFESMTHMLRGKRTTASCQKNSVELSMLQRNLENLVEKQLAENAIGENSSQATINT